MKHGAEFQVPKSSASEKLREMEAAWRVVMPFRACLADLYWLSDVEVEFIATLPLEMNESAVLERIVCWMVDAERLNFSRRV